MPEQEESPNQGPPEEDFDFRSEVAKEWIEVAMRRRDEILSGEVEPIPGELVFDEFRRRFKK